MQIKTKEVLPYQVDLHDLDGRFSTTVTLADDSFFISVGMYHDTLVAGEVYFDLLNHSTVGDNFKNILRTQELVNVND